jgi:hypothetical protein
MGSASLIALQLHQLPVTIAFSRTHMACCTAYRPLLANMLCNVKVDFKHYHLKQYKMCNKFPSTH